MKHPLNPILDTIADVVIVIDPRGTILAANPSAEAMLGWLPHELVGKNVSMLAGGVHGAHHDQYLSHYAETGERRILGRPRRLEARRKDGTLLPITLAVTEAVVHDQTVFTGVIRDASAEAERERDLARVAGELRVQMSINRVLQNARSPSELVEGVLHEIISLDDLDVHKKAGVFLLETQESDKRRLPMVSHGPGRLRLGHTVGSFSAEFLEREATVALGACLCGRAALGGEVLVSHNCFEDDRHEHGFHGMTPHGHYIVPIRADGRVTGVLFLYTDTNPVWDERRATLLETLGTQIGIGLARASAEEALKRQRAELHRLAHYDDLTSILNRRATLDRLVAERSRAERSGDSVSVILLDVDHFKSVNDQHGHAVGDAVLQEVAARAKRAIRPYDEVGRYGGEEFLVVLPECDAVQAAAVAERIRRHFADTPVETTAGPLPITASFGVACCTCSIDELVIKADVALYKAKDEGRNRVHIAENAVAGETGPHTSKHADIESPEQALNTRAIEAQNERADDAGAAPSIVPSKALSEPLLESIPN